MSLLNTNINDNTSKEGWKILKSPINKILFIIICILILLIILINPILNIVAKPKILNSLKSRKNLNVNAGYAGYNVFTQNFSIDNIRISMKDSASGDSADFYIPYFQMSNLKLLKLIVGSGLSFNEMIFNHPHLFVKRTFKNNKKELKKNENKDPDNSAFLNILPERLKPLTFRQISINFLTLSQIINDKEYNDSVKKILITAEDVKIDSSVIQDSLSLKYASGLNILIEDLSYHFKDDYLIKLGNLKASSSDSTFILKDITYKPYISDSAFFSHRKYSSDRYKIRAPFISLKGINFNKLIWRNSYLFRYIDARDLNISICTNKEAPPDTNSIPKMPNEIMRSAKKKISIKDVRLKNWTIHIRARHPYVKKYSDVTFTKVSGEIKNVSNTPKEQSEKNPCKLDISGSLYGLAKLSIKMNLPLLSQNLSFDYKGELNSMSALPINNQIKPADHVKLKSGEIESINFSVHVLRSAADVYVKPIYKNLKIEKLKENSEEGGVANKAGSFIANNFVIRTSNPNKDGEIKIGSIIYLKDKGDTFLDVIWTSVKKGLGEVVGF